jgi:hypothetical protein
VAVSEGVAKFWLLPLFGHWMACPPAAAASFCTSNGANVLWPDRLSSSTIKLLPATPLLLEDELELLDEELDELDEELLVLLPLLLTSLTVILELPPLRKPSVAMI